MRWLDRAYHRFYLWAQYRQSFAKRGKDPAFRTERHLEMVRPYLQPWPAKTLCLGPRNSLELQYLRHAGAHSVVGLDLFSTSPSEIKVGDMHAMPFPDREFGMVWASHVLEHAKDPKVVFGEIERVLKPGGWLFAAYPTGFKTNWHDRWDYGDPVSLLDYVRIGSLRKYAYVESGSSAEFHALYQIG